MLQPLVCLVSQMASRKMELEYWFINLVFDTVVGYMVLLHKTLCKMYYLTHYALCIMYDVWYSYINQARALSKVVLLLCNGEEYYNVTHLTEFTSIWEIHNQ